MLKHVTDATFQLELQQATKPVLLKVYATWCGPCRMLTPIVELIAKERTDLEVWEIDSDESPATVQGLGVLSLPSLVLFKDGSELARKAGYLRKEVIESQLLSTLP